MGDNKSKLALLSALVVAAIAALIFSVMKTTAPEPMHKTRDLPGDDFAKARATGGDPNAPPTEGK
jgi:hypothetical protein